MEIEKVIKLMEAFSSSNLTSFKYKEGNVSLNFKNEKENLEEVKSEPLVEVAETTGLPVTTESNTVIIAESPVVESSKTVETVEVEGTSEVVSAEASDNYIIKSPTVGTFYEASSPDSDPFVQVGDVVKKGQVVCIVEAMKVMNEIDSPIDGVVVEIPTKNEELVEFGQALVVLKPIA